MLLLLLILWPIAQLLKKNAVQIWNAGETSFEKENIYFFLGVVIQMS